MGHIQTPVDTGSGEVGLMSGVPVRGVEDAEGPPGEFEEEDFKCSVIFGEDFRKPAYWGVLIPRLDKMWIPYFLWLGQQT